MKTGIQSMMPVRSVLLLALAGTLALSACGRKAPLDTPYQAAVDARREAEQNREPLPPEPTPPVQDRRFILDGLID